MDFRAQARNWTECGWALKMAAPMQYHYRLFGLCIASDIELPELIEDAAPRSPDVRISHRLLPRPTGKSDELLTDGGSASFFIEGVAHYQVSGGREIRVDPQRGAPMRNVRLYLLGSAMGLLLHQRGSLPLHANAVEIEGRGFAFMGSSGSGKSTLAAAFHDKGFRVIADDVCVISFDTDALPVVHCGIPRLRLWEDALEASGRSPADHQMSYAGDDRFRKFDVPTSQRTADSVTLSAIFELVPGEQICFDRLSGLPAVEAIFANTYRGGFIASTGDAQAHWQACLKLVSSVPIFRLRRPLTPESTSRVIAEFESDGWADLVERKLVADN